MSPVFRHGGLRLYLLKLLDEAPRHGYDVIRLLQDKFLGVYSPSPGTIYPRLARLEEEGLVTHETVDGKKIYRITDAGRAELNRRLDDLADLEDELAASVRDIAKEISRDVRETVRNLRDELTWAVREAGRAGGASGSRADSGKDRRGGSGTNDYADAGGDSRATTDAKPETEAWSKATAAAGTQTADTEQAKANPAGARKAASARDAGAGQAGQEDSAGDGAKAAGTSRGQDAGSPLAGDEGRSGEDGEDGQQRQRRQSDWRDDWRDWADWAKRQGWADWTGRQDRREHARAGRPDWSQWTQRPDWLKGAGPRDRHESPADLVSDLEQLAASFAREIRGVARHAEGLGEDTVGNLGRILGDALNRIRTEVFRTPDPADPAPPSEQAPNPHDGTE
jgi:DNA-binding PadR family transcriptional regulator